MTIILRQKKGAPLTVEEVDNNFIELLQRIEQLEHSTPAQECLAQIKQEGDTLIFIGSLGSQLGHARLPTLKMTPRGAWKTSCDYFVNDVVTYNNVIYICTQNHASQSFDQETKQWLKMFEPFNAMSSGSSGSASMPASTMITLPIMTDTKIAAPTFGNLAIYARDDVMEVLVGDINCWRRLRDQTEFKFGAQKV